MNDSFIENENKHNLRRITIVRPHTTEVKTQEQLAKELQAHEEERPKQGCFSSCMDSIAESCVQM